VIIRNPCDELVYVIAMFVGVSEVNKSIMDDSGQKDSERKKDKKRKRGHSLERGTKTNISHIDTVL
jgi:hypothetical protein